MGISTFRTSTIPVLMINGEDDGLFDVETSQKPMFDDFMNDRMPPRNT